MIVIILLFGSFSVSCRLIQPAAAWQTSSLRDWIAAHFFGFIHYFFFPQMRATIVREDLTNIPRQIQICSQYDFRGTTTAHNDSFNDSISQVRNVQTIYISCLECIIDHKHKTQKLRIKTFNNTLTSRSYTHLKRYVISGNFLFMQRSFIKFK